MVYTSAGCTQLRGAAEVENTDHMWGADGSAVSNSPAGDTYEPNILDGLPKTQLRRILVCVVLVQHVICPIDVGHCLEKGTAPGRESVNVSVVANTKMVLTLATRSEWYIPLFAMLLISSALVLPVQRQAIMYVVEYCGLGIPIDAYDVVVMAVLGVDGAC